MANPTPEQIKALAALAAAKAKAPAAPAQAPAPSVGLPSGAPGDQTADGTIDTAKFPVHEVRWNPVARALGLLTGAGKTLLGPGRTAPGQNPDASLQYTDPEAVRRRTLLANIDRGYRQGTEDLEHRVEGDHPTVFTKPGEPHNDGRAHGWDRVGRDTWNAVTSLGRIPMGVAALAVDTLGPHLTEAPKPGNPEYGSLVDPNKTAWENAVHAGDVVAHKAAEQFRGGKQTGEDAQAGVLGGTMALMEKPGRALEADPAAYLLNLTGGAKPLLRGVEALRAGRAVNRVSRMSPLTKQTITEENLARPASELARRTGDLGADKSLVTKAVDQVGQMLDKIPGAQAAKDVYLKNLADGFHGRDPAVRALYERLARGGEQVAEELKVAVQQLAGAVERDYQGPKLATNMLAELPKPPKAGAAVTFEEAARHPAAPPAEESFGLGHPNQGMSRAEALEAAQEELKKEWHRRIKMREAEYQTGVAPPGSQGPAGNGPPMRPGLGLKSSQVISDEIIKRINEKLEQDLKAEPDPAARKALEGQARRDRIQEATRQEKVEQRLYDQFQNNLTKEGERYKQGHQELARRSQAEEAKYQERRKGAIEKIRGQMETRRSVEEQNRMKEAGFAPPRDVARISPLNEAGEPYQEPRLEEAAPEEAARQLDALRRAAQAGPGTTRAIARAAQKIQELNGVADPEAPGVPPELTTENLKRRLALHVSDALEQNWRAQYAADPWAVTKKYLAAVKDKLARALTKEEKVGLAKQLEANGNIEFTEPEAPETGVKLGAQFKPEATRHMDLTRTRQVPVLDGVRLDPAELLPPDITDVKAAVEQAARKSMEDYTTQQRQHRDLAAEHDRPLRYNLPEEAAAPYARHEVEARMALKPPADGDYTSPAGRERLAAVEETRQAIQATTDKFKARGEEFDLKNPAHMLEMYGDLNQAGPHAQVGPNINAARYAAHVEHGALAGDIPPQLLPPGVNPHNLADGLEKVGAADPAVQATAKAFKRYRPLDTKLLGYLEGTPPIYVEPLLGDALEWHKKAADGINDDTVRAINRIVKGNLTIRNIPAALNNRMANVTAKTITTGVDPVSYTASARKILKQLNRHANGEPVSAADSRAFDALRSANFLDQDWATVEGGLSAPGKPSMKEAAPRGLGWTHGPSNKVNAAQERVYMNGDKDFRVKDGVDEFNRLARDVDGLKPGEFYDLDVSRRQKVRVERQPDGRWTVQDPTALNRADTAPRPVTEAELDKLMGRAAGAKAVRLTMDYGDVAQLAKRIKTWPVHGILSPFMGWAAAAIDLPGKPGLTWNTYVRSPYAVSTNSAQALARAAWSELGLAMRKAVVVQGLRQAYMNHPEIQEPFKNSPEGGQTWLVNKLSDPGTLAGVNIGSWASLGPTEDLLRFAAFTAGAPGRAQQHVQASKTGQRFAQYVRDADTGNMWNTSKALGLIYLGGGPLLDLWQGFDTPKESGKVFEPQALADRLLQMAAGGTWARVTQGLVGTAADTGQESHPRLSAAIKRTPVVGGALKLLGGNARDRQVSTQARLTTPVAMWWVTQLTGKGWKAKDFNANRPADVSSYLSKAKKEWYASLGLESKSKRRATDTKARQEQLVTGEAGTALGSAQLTAQQRVLKRAVDASIRQMWADYVHAYFATHGVPPTAAPPELPGEEDQPAPDTTPEPTGRGD